MSRSLGHLGEGASCGRFAVAEAGVCNPLLCGSGGEGGIGKSGSCCDTFGLAAFSCMSFQSALQASPVVSLF